VATPGVVAPGVATPGASGGFAAGFAGAGAAATCAWKAVMASASAPMNLANDPGKVYPKKQLV
jgi:hypothetical protein